MGWFSDDSGDEEPTAASSSPNKPQNGDDDEEEDPLDAYMNSLDANSSTASAKPSGQRLDHDAEDEATSHWESKRPSSTSDRGSAASSRLLPSNPHAESQAATQQLNYEREARLAISTTFVKAGDKRSHVHLKNGQDDHDDGDEDNEPSLQQLAQQNMDMHHQEISPLETINHNTITYPPFRKIFVPPKNTPSFTQWRDEHSITCQPPIDPILHFDPEIFPMELIKRIVKSGYDTPTLVQCQTLGVALAGRDGLITAATGSGKSEYFIYTLECASLCEPAS
jgi:hypothetical protein